MQTIRVDTPSAKYDVFAGSGLIGSLVPRIERVAGKLPRRVFVLTSPEIWALWGDAFLKSFVEPPTTLFLPSGEKHKTLKSVDRHPSANDRRPVRTAAHCSSHSAAASWVTSAASSLPSSCAASAMCRYPQPSLRRSTHLSAARPASIFLKAKTSSAAFIIQPLSLPISTFSAHCPIENCAPV